MLSQSSAYPPGDDAVQLRARVHMELGAIEKSGTCDEIAYSSNVSWDELDEIRLLHTEWFPVEYHDDFFESIVTGTGFGGGDVVTVVARVGTNPRHIVGIITVAIKRDEKQYNPTADVCPALDINGNYTTAYILTLGVVDELRGKGVGKELLQRGIQKVQVSDPLCRLVYLHVIEYNEAARKFYLRENFIQFNRYKEFYFFNGRVFDGILLYRRIEENDRERGVWKVTRWLYEKVRQIFQVIFTVKRPRKDDTDYTSSSLV